MSGFVALVALDARRSVDPAALEALAASYEALRGPGQRSSITAGSWAGAVKIETGTTETAGIEGDEETWALHVGAAYGPRPLATASLASLEGQFALLRRRGGDRHVSLAVDPFGMQATYVARRDGLAYLSTSALALARHLRAAPDREGIRAWLRSGLQLGAPTLWTGVSRLEPATELRLGPGMDEEHVSWRPAIDPQVARLDFGRSVDRIIDVATAALQPLRDRPTAWADLTAGFDTRMLDLLLDRAGVPFETQTRETRRDVDMRIARRVAARAGWPWRAFRLPATWPAEFPAWVPTALGWSDGHLDALHLARNLRGHADAAATHQALFVGIGGDHMRGHAWRQELYREGRSNRPNYDNLLDMRLLHPIDTGLFAADPTPLTRARLRDQVTARARPYQGEINTVQLDAIHAFKMTAHAGAFCSADGGFLRAQLPFYHRPIFTAAFSTNFRHRNNHRLMRHVIERLNPAVSAIETDTGGPAQAWRLGNLHRFAPYYANLARKAVNKLSHRAIGRELLPVQLETGSTMAEAIAGYIRSLALDPATMRSGSLYAAPPLRQLLADAADGRFRDLDLLGRIVTIELALEAADAGLA